MKTFNCGSCFRIHTNVKLEIDEAHDEFVTCPITKRRIYLQNEKNDQDIKVGAAYKWEAEMYHVYQSSRKKR